MSVCMCGISMAYICVTYYIKLIKLYTLCLCLLLFSCNYNPSIRRTLWCGGLVNVSIGRHNVLNYDELTQNQTVVMGWNC